MPQITKLRNNIPLPRSAAATTGRAGISRPAVPALQLKASSVENQYGKFTATSYSPHPTDIRRDMVGAEFRLQWQPDTSVIQDGTFGLVQKVNRTQLGIRKIKDGGPIEHSKPDGIHDFFKRITTDGAEQQHIDSLAEDYGNGKFKTDHPVYGSLGKHTGLEIEPTTMERPSNEISVVNNSTVKSNAKLDDKPAVFRYLTGDKEAFIGGFAADKPAVYEVFNRDEFEVRVLGLSGPLKGKYLGGIKWGWVKDGEGHREDPEEISLFEDDLPTDEFVAAALKWNQAKINAPEKDKKKAGAGITLGGLALGVLAGGGLLTGAAAFGLLAGGALGYLYGKNMKVAPVKLPIPEKDKDV